MTNIQPQRKCGQVMVTQDPQTDQIHLFITWIQVLSVRALKFQQGHKLTMGVSRNPRTKASVGSVICNKTLSNFIHLYHFKS